MDVKPGEGFLMFGILPKKYFAALGMWNAFIGGVDKHWKASLIIPIQSSYDDVGIL